MLRTLLLASVMLAAVPASAGAPLSEVHAVVEDGDLAPLDKLLDRQELLELNPGELRLLRNTLFARHGRKFKSDDLQQHFKKFEWYKPHAKKVRLDSVDQGNLLLIQGVEAQKQIEPELIGVWHASPMMAAGWSEVLIFRKGFAFEWHANSMDCAKRLTGESGRWSFNEGALMLHIKKRSIIEGGKLVPGTASCGTDELVGGTGRTVTLDPPEIKTYLLTRPKKFSDPGLGDRVMMKLGEHGQWFHWSSNPDAYP